MVYLPQLKQLAIGSEDSLLRLARVETVPQSLEVDHIQRLITNNHPAQSSQLSGQSVWCSTPDKIMKGHRRAINQVLYCPLSQYLLSSGYETLVYLWNPLVEKPIKALDHDGPVLIMACVQDGNVPLLVTSDHSLNIKVWHLSSFLLLGQLKVDLSKGCPVWAVSNRHRRIFLGRQQVRTWQLCSNHSKELTDDAVISAVALNYFNMEVYTGSERNVKVWALAEGTLVRQFLNLVAGVVTALESDTQLNKSVYIGDSLGHIYKTDLKKGVILQRLTGHH